MKKTIYILVILAGILLFTSKAAFGYSPGYINILNDVIAMPVFLILLETIMKFLFGSAFRLTLAYIVATFLTVSISFEGLLPLKYAYMTADVADIVWYLTGTLLFILFQLNNVFKTQRFS